MVLGPAISHCPLCGNKLHVRKTYPRGLKGKNVVIKLTVKELHCDNPDCELYHVPVIPEGLMFLFLPKMVYGTDVLFFVGEKRLGDWQLKQVREVLGVKPSISSLSRFFHLFEQLSQCFFKSYEEKTKAVIRKQKGYVLMADATEHRESRPLYHVMDALSGRLLAVERLERNDYECIKPVWERVKEKYGTPRAILSDDDSAQRKVRLELFPETKWIYCQYHFLKNLGEKLLEEYYTTLMEKVKELAKEVEREVQSLGRMLETYVSVERYREFSDGVRTILKARGKFPFDLGWLEVYDALKILFRSILEVSMKGRAMTHLKMFVARNIHRLKELGGNAEKLRELNASFVQVREVLGTAKNAKDAEEKLKKLAAETEEKTKIISERIYKYLDSLVAAYTIEGVPRTIGDLELFHRDVKRPVMLENRPAFEAHGEGLSYAREVVRQGMLGVMWCSLPALVEELGEMRSEEAVKKKEEKESRSRMRRYRELAEKNPEEYAARMMQLIKEIDDLETGKSGKPPPSEEDEKPQDSGD